MKKRVLFMHFYLFFSITVQCFGQSSLKGLWNGYITTDGYEHKAGYIINIEEHKDGIVSGKALLYKPNLYSEAYGLQQFIGTIEQNTILISDIQILDERLPTEDFHLCFKLSRLSYSPEGENESLKGKWNSNTTNCVPGAISLSRYIENENKQVPPYVLHALKAKGTEANFKNTALSPPISISVKKPIIDIELKDYLKVDNDTVSIYLNRRIILNRINVTKKPYKFTVKINRNIAVNELILYANNLGTIPPNTSLLIINDGIQKHKILIESSLQKSVALYLNYKP
ncbi:hypothetical protein WG906_03830 [Pedobacter sp. P351]|uniref:hypothetical protein n=1 Tax=Pedobacter superstes TaxID=3133441 RepID=UPI0030AE0C1E